jgi:tRNA threonylcarbamoyladenosine biosynthesis protein TsaB
MRILAIETVAAAGSVALLVDEELVVPEVELEAARRSAQTLAPGIAGLLERVGWSPADIELVAVASGPGSFTGLRIGITTAKAFAYAVGCQVAGVNTLLAIASRAPRELETVSAVIDAQRGELFVADFTRQPDGQLIGIETTRIVAAETWLASLPSRSAITGPGLSQHHDTNPQTPTPSPFPAVSGPGLSKHLAVLPPGTIVVDQALWSPTAAIIGQLGREQVLAGQGVSPFELVPEYFRRTAAEEKWDAKQA